MTGNLFDADALCQPEHVFILMMIRNNWMTTGPGDLCTVLWKQQIENHFIRFNVPLIDDQALELNQRCGYHCSIHCTWKNATSSMISYLMTAWTSSYGIAGGISTQF
jgi:hypothetical protein